jgi:hypothetical protein
MFVHQHDPALLGNGNILLFDHPGAITDYDPSQMQVITELSGATGERRQLSLL